MSHEHRPETFLVAYHVRGRQRRSSLTMQVLTLEEIIRRGEELFPSFQARNPWISVDSTHNTVFVGIDPDRQNRAVEGKPHQRQAEAN
jgi:hypothetical protein